MLETTLRAARDRGRKLLVPYLTGGLNPEWVTTLRAMAAAGADGLEVGIPFSDPVMDGPTVQLASERALAAGATPAGILEDLHDHDIGAPLAVMTYYNIVFRAGHERFAASLGRAGVDGAILPDVPLEEIDPWAAVADGAGIETVLLAAPTADDERLGRICERARGFVYAVGLLGVTGERDELAASAKVIAKRLKALTDKPVLVGVGISTPAQAADVCQEADGVVVGSAIVRRAMEGSPEDVAALVGEFREALDAGL